MKRVIEDELIEQTFAEVEAHLSEAEDMMLPSLEAKIRDVRDRLKVASDVLSRLEFRVTRLKGKS